MDLEKNSVGGVRRDDMKEIKSRVSAYRTICEIHREMHDILLGEKRIPKDIANKLIDLLEEAYINGKKMNTKLTQYKMDYDDGWWERSRTDIIKEKLKRRGINQTAEFVNRQADKEKR